MEKLKITVKEFGGEEYDLEVKHFYYSDRKIYFFETNDNDFFLFVEDVESISIRQ